MIKRSGLLSVIEFNRYFKKINWLLMVNLWVVEFKQPYDKNKIIV